ncbi:hypothetical protein VTK26DRAFT_1794 [Humicola hyalothermophila]
MTRVIATLNNLLLAGDFHLGTATRSSTLQRSSRRSMDSPHHYILFHLSPLRAYPSRHRHSRDARWPGRRGCGEQFRRIHG